MNSRFDECASGHKLVDTVSVRTTSNKGQYGLFWEDCDGNNFKFICYVFGFENAVRVANGISHNQCEFVKHPPFPISSKQRKSR